MAAELGTDLIAVGVVDRVEDPQGLGPGPAGRGGIARAAIHVAEAAERVSLAETVGELPGQVDGPLVARDGLRVAADLVMDVAKAVPGALFPVAFSKALDPGQSLLTVGEGQAAPTTAPLTVDPAALSQVFIGSSQSRPTSVFSGRTPQVGTLLFNGNAPSGTVVTLASSSPAASVSASVTAAGQLVSFSITTQQVTATTPVVITASWRGKTVSVKMILQPPPILQAPAAGASFATGQVVIFRWHTPFGLSSELQVAINPHFKNPVTDVNTNTAHAWGLSSLPSGTLYWRVLGVDVYGVDGPSSAVRTFTVKPPSGPLPAPVPEFPANGATVTAGQQVAFFWQPVNGAASYELQVANTSAFTPPLVLDRTVKTN
jgi:hypothetical protein